MIYKFQYGGTPLVKHTLNGLTWRDQKSDEEFSLWLQDRENYRKEIEAEEALKHPNKYRANQPGDWIPDREEPWNINKAKKVLAGLYKDNQFYPTILTYADEDGGSKTVVGADVKPTETIKPDNRNLLARTWDHLNDEIDRTPGGRKLVSLATFFTPIKGASIASKLGSVGKAAKEAMVHPKQTWNAISGAAKDMKKLFNTAWKGNWQRGALTTAGLLAHDIGAPIGYAKGVDYATEKITGKPFAESFSQLTGMPTIVGEIVNPGYNFAVGNTGIGKRALETTMRTVGGDGASIGALPQMIKNATPYDRFNTLKYIFAGHDTALPESIFNQLSLLDRAKVLTMNPSKWFEKDPNAWLYLTSKTGQELGFGKNHLIDTRSLKPTHVSYTGFGNKTGESGLAPDPVSAYVYGTQLAPEYFDRMPNDWPTWSKSYAYKDIPIYRIKPNSSPITSREHYVPSSDEWLRGEAVEIPTDEARKIMQSTKPTTVGYNTTYVSDLFLPDWSFKGGIPTLLTPKFLFGSNRLNVLDAGGFLGHTFQQEGQSPAVMSEDIWRFEPSRYFNKWAAKENGGNILKDALAITGLHHAHHYGHPFITQSLLYTTK